MEISPVSDGNVQKMYSPMDALVKISFNRYAQLMHEFYRLPGQFVNSCVNEYVTHDGRQRRVDVAYIVSIKDEKHPKGKKYIINIEDESSKVDEKTLEKINEYRECLTDVYHLPVISVITTNLSKDRCLQEYRISESHYLRPKIISYCDMDGEKLLNTLNYKVDNNINLTDIETLYFIAIPRMLSKNTEEIVKDLCYLFSRETCIDDNLKKNLRYAMRCIIHKYLKANDIHKFEEVIGLNLVYTLDEEIHKSFFNQGKEEGREEGREEGLEEGREEGLEEGIVLGENDLILLMLEKMSAEHIHDTFDIPFSKIERALASK